MYSGSAYLNGLSEALWRRGLPELLVSVLELVKLPVESALGEELLVGAALAQGALVHDEYGVRRLDGAETMRNEDAGASGDHAREGEADAVLSVRIDRAGSFVEDEDGWSMGQRAGETDELLLAGGEGGAALAHRLRELGGQGADEVGDIDLFAGTLELIVGDPRRAEADVLRDGAGEEEGILQDDAEATAEGIEILVPDIDSIHEDRASLDVIEAHHERGDSGFAGAGVADDGCGFSGCDGKGDAAEDPFDVGERTGGESGRKIG